MDLGVNIDGFWLVFWVVRMIVKGFGVVIGYCYSSVYVWGSEASLLGIIYGLGWVIEGFRILITLVLGCC